jgi:hypothetical protein
LNFILSLFFFFAKVGKKSQCLLVHFGSILLALPILDRFLLQIYKKIIKESHKPIKKPQMARFLPFAAIFCLFER